MKDIMKIVKSVEDSDLLLNGFTEAILKEAKQNKKEDFLVCYYVH